jgi:hypothetical protein
MGVFKTPEEKAADQDERQQRAFLESPQGQARLAFERGDEVFQLQMPLYEQQAIIVAMVGSSTAGRASDPSAELNRVISEGWELLSSGQNVAIKGQVTGYHLFRRAPDKRRQP